ncbi:sigma factor-like helix-turn-helix DNA-binding protein [uncultured Endozoicomonas sp.]|uniref:sigma factor-like helix-turn-helix DNA-binding protein n=1 Tax=uncultured Endozoicomonas sp. TaxID=432652 RepID=UPI002635283E|nr:sigma factor-like helix-turn-helix DNA-binding protein [uncultured Endozoicomonas sp.]
MTPKERREKILAIYAINPEEKISNVAEMTGIPEGTVRYLRRVLGIQQKRNWLSDETKQQIFDLRAKGLTYKQIGEELGVRAATVESTVKRSSSRQSTTRKEFIKRAGAGIPVMELFEKTKANLLLTVKWSQANVQRIYQ